MDQHHVDALAEAIAGLFRNDEALFNIGINERSLTHKLAEYLQAQYPGWHVDCEYNRKGAEVKRLPNPESVKSDDTKGTTIFPDIVIHKRTERNNLFIIEVKKSGNDNHASDTKKLEQLTLRDGDFAYIYGIHLIFAENEAKIESFSLYENGELSERNSAFIQRQFKDRGLLG